MTRNPTRNFRPGPAEYDTAKAVAENAGYPMDTLLRAFLRLFNAEPAKTMKLLKPHLRAIADEKPTRGRPRRDAGRPESG
jgi:hypothetical protein